ncbi:S26 family signal peptidase [Hyphomonas sp. UBA4494]|jgi:conjugative transfer signal peptidase TraF|uniref:S26 family signal peptidase n=1 Tax=Hyphomonas sp. UBA4494 TaxID=1946631 RepID=UPI0025BD00CC|nr:S26 family signal peptidase [Hyphomonas sp. UBA4494]
MDQDRAIPLALSALGAGILWAGFVLKPAPRLLYNPSESAPIGWYKVEPLKIAKRGDLVASRLPGHAESLAATRGYLPADIPVIKTVWAVVGDRVCVDAGVLTVAGQPPLPLLGQDRSGRPLPVWTQGCTSLRLGEILLISNETPESFDSRYFGPVSLSHVIGRAVFLGDISWHTPDEREASDWEGGDCKIKAHGANEGSSPCLHIDFYGSITEDIAPSSERMLNDDYRIGWLHSGELACFPPEQPE